MRKFRFRQFPVYQEVRIFRRTLKSVAQQKFPERERFGLTAQFLRALDSIALNIAEGADRGTDRDFAHFLNQAHTSLNEVVSCLDLALDDGYLTDGDHLEYLRRAEQLANQLTAFRAKLLREPTK